MTFVCIAGMHRSGTSLVARAANLLGLHLGRPGYLMPANKDNPAGHWEHERFVQLDECLLDHLGGWWHQPPTLPDCWEYAYGLRPFRTWGARLVADHLPNAPVVGFKDPRLSLLLPFWRTVVDVDRTVLCIRDPREVAASLARRDGFSAEWSAHLWLRYIVSAWRSDPSHLLVQYDDWFSSPAAVVDRLARFLGLDPTSDARRKTIERAFRSDLRHQHADDDQKAGPQMQLALYLYENARSSPNALAPLVGELHSGPAAPPGF